MGSDQEDGQKLTSHVVNTTTATCSQNARVVGWQQSFPRQSSHASFSKALSPQNNPAR
jgi:hypothetical protein